MLDKLFTNIDKSSFTFVTSFPLLNYTTNIS
ncbi:hypothetical protein [Clostridium saccharobutylicum]